MTALHQASAPYKPNDRTHLDDWIGLAHYLAQAVQAGEVTVDVAEAALADATGDADSLDVKQAAEIAVTEYGLESVTVGLLRSVSTRAAA